MKEYLEKLGFKEITLNNFKLELIDHDILIRHKNVFVSTKYGDKMSMFKYTVYNHSKIKKLIQVLS